MRKNEELLNPAGCFNSALEGELMFVLLARDQAAPTAIRAWVTERIRLGKNVETDQKIVEALQCADKMEREYGAVRDMLGKPR